MKLYSFFTLLSIASALKINYNSFKDSHLEIHIPSDDHIEAVLYCKHGCCSENEKGFYHCESKCCISIVTVRDSHHHHA